MATPKGGNFGKVLEIDLSKQTFKTRPVSDEILQQYIGGRGLGAYYAVTEYKAGKNALDEDAFLAMNEFLDHHYLPFTIPVSLEHGKDEDLFFRLAPSLAPHRFAGESAVAHVCTRSSCAPPAFSVEDLSKRLG